ncbi:Glutamyl tRNA reductase [Guillardia theta CCMP2712]|uniref:Glutamyl-tRNA reductase n=1 Tax=Guillardia theta (strain CCMP2712) TaxID=905079 RepID=L1IR05_GUITC|nr:Glutamyl tRNA reductase [Guillardia theta CCMP2712]EKX38294.1 Glutamyl tRNA reductase [Guillardia theta CCMP2712]|eukprot:XP_005825274.1 Glutamyl tRNA reductase [Guillardia theta CCMP2712]
MQLVAGLVLLSAASCAAFSPVAPLRVVGSSAARLNVSPARFATRPILANVRMDMEIPKSLPIEPKTKEDRKGKPSETRVVVLGLSHKTATVEVREKLAVQEHNWQSVGRAIAALPSLKEAAVLSTCNRFEIYFVTNDVHAGIREVTEYLSTTRGVSMKELRSSLFMLSEDDAVWHALRVAGGLDSLVIGEGQILSQMKRCYEIATEKQGAAGKVLTRMLNTAVSAGKRVRSETGIARGGVSISSAAVELVEKNCLQDLDLDMDQLDICILGAGKMARLLVQHLLPRNVKSITIVNRSQQGADNLASMFPDANIKTALMDSMLEMVGTSHVTFACTGAMEPILYQENLEGAMQRGAMLVDISVPRNIDDVGANKVEGVKAYNVDDLKAVVAANQARRQRLVLEAEELLQDEMKSFKGWHQSLGTVPMITKLQSRANKIRREELLKYERKLSGLSAQERETVERLTKGIVAKLLHGPMSHLRTVDDVSDRQSTVKSLEAMFRL